MRSPHAGSVTPEETVASHRSLKTYKFIIYLYFITVAFFVIGSFLPHYRIWSLNNWSYLGMYATLPLLGLAILLAAGIMRLRIRDSSFDEDERVQKGSRQFYVASTVVVTFALSLLFYLLRAKIHLLGDGYLQLSMLAADNPITKSRDFGEMMIHVWAHNLIRSDGTDSALLAYQLLSVGSGIAFVLCVALFAKFLFERLRPRILFLLGLTSSGYMLLFFGYVENYSLLCLSIALFTLTGLLIAQGRLKRWFIIPPLALCPFLHILGITVVPAGIYLLVAKSRLALTLATTTGTVRTAVGLAIAVGAACLVYYFYSTSYFFRFALLSPVTTRFTAEGYTLFSFEHLMDYWNLLLVLVPGLLLFAAFTVELSFRSLLKRAEYVFLFLLVLSGLGTAFILEAKLGMPRDWDLFAFPGVPLAVLIYYSILDPRIRFGFSSQSALLAIALGFLSLMPRAIIQHIPTLGIEQFQNYANLDRAKNRTGMYVLSQYYLDAGATEQVNRVEALRKKLYPEEDFARAARQAVREDQLSQAESLLTKVIAINPNYPPGWAIAGTYYMKRLKYDSALQCLLIADGLNPYEPRTIYHIGRLYFNTGELDAAERAFKLAAHLEPSSHFPVKALADVYLSRGDEENYVQYLNRAASGGDAPPSVAEELMNYHLWKRDFQEAAAALQLAVDRGLDGHAAKEIVEANPALGEWLR